MCGIVGVYNLNNNPTSHQIIKSMTDSISHRGPDGEGLYLNENVALGHRRLSILDLSQNGAQPMFSHDGNWVIVFNGCIYNYLLLKADLQSKGHKFNSTSDTEVISEGLSEYGVSFFEKLNGMFAVGAYNINTKKLWLSRDRFGVKPLYYWSNENTILFSSEIKAFLKHPDFKVEVDLQALNEYFTFQNVFSTKTLFKGVTMLPPANTVEVSIEAK